MRFGPPITFRHPLIREAIYQGANDAERRRTHAALADATEITEDPDRHAWHRAAATLSPDEDVAAELEAAAARARQQGSYASTALLLTRVAELTPDATRRGLRLLDAAASHLTAAHPGRAQTAFESALPMVHDPFVRGRRRASSRPRFRGRSARVVRGWHRRSSCKRQPRYAKFHPRLAAARSSSTPFRWRFGSGSGRRRVCTMLHAWRRRCHCRKTNHRHRTTSRSMASQSSSSRVRWLRRPSCDAHSPSSGRNPPPVRYRPA